MSIESVEARAPSVDVLPFLNSIVPFDGHISAMNRGREIDERVLGIPTTMSESRGRFKHTTFVTV